MLAVFLESIGLPVPAAIALLIAGASGAHGPLHIAPVIVAATAAMMAGDLLMYTLGRLTGWWLLGVLCRISLNPESCVLRSADTFYKRGRRILLIAKFLPGINTMAGPLAGSMTMPLRQFVPLDLAGVVLYVSSYALVGYLFSDFVGAIERGIETAGSVMGWVLLGAIVVFVGYRLIRLRAARSGDRIPMVLPHEVPANASIFDVRSHGYYEKNAVRIKGSARMEPNALSCQLSQVSGASAEVILYCTCVNEATAVKVAREMKAKGFTARVLTGGLKGWRAAGLPTESVPDGEILVLPHFS